MAASPSHRFGQIVGETLEEIMLPALDAFCTQRGLFLDRKGARTARSGRKLTWTDNYGNSHDLDFVIEKNGTPEKLGRPLAFIEAAWRRYTKHSKNKAQEIQGALLPIADKYAWDKPFLGVVLAGMFTKPSLEQLRSSGFQYTLFPYKSVVQAFRVIGIDVAFDEETEDRRFVAAVDTIEQVRREDQTRWQSLKAALVSLNPGRMDEFLQHLQRVLDRTVDEVLIVPMHGREALFGTVDEALRFIQKHDQGAAGGPFLKYEARVRFNNGDKVEASFSHKEELARFLSYVSN